MTNILHHTFLKIISPVTTVILLANFWGLLPYNSTGNLAQPQANQNRSSSGQDFEYISPPPDAQLVSVGTTIAIRPGEVIKADSVSRDFFTVNGSSSGVHQGQTLLADDQKTVIFKPAKPFVNEETVTVSVRKGLITAAGETLAGITFDFATSPLKPPWPERQQPNRDDTAAVPDGQNLGYVTLPVDIPAITITISTKGARAAGYLFLSNISGNTTPYLLIIDDQGEPVYYKKVNQPTGDFKKQPNGQLTYWDQSALAFQVMNASYQIVDTYQAGNGYEADGHGLQLLPNGHALLMIYDLQTIDMSQIVPGGVPTATVAGLVVQELDTAKNVVFEWRSWDHFAITDTTVNTTSARIDYAHGNAVEQAHDGHLLISSRNLNEITKIDRNTGEVLWRLGGKQNEFTFINDNTNFYKQHDIRSLPNGHITLFDNGNDREPPYSRVVEYQLDEINKTATLISEYRNKPDIFASALGSAQRLSNGNILIGWGNGPNSDEKAGWDNVRPPNVTEVNPDGTKVFELTFAPPNVSYRAFRFPWQGQPVTRPTLVVQTDGATATLSYSWNGATEIATYHIYGGAAPKPTTLINTQIKTGFENTTVITGLNQTPYYFRVMPIDRNGNETRYSNEVAVLE
ncbi:MAG: aryl-sulfate sulfotransferase [Anaerolineae bacterium]|nr:aryl-sulfate sulfotransferase [Anaerolineae bacterium]